MKKLAHNKTGTNHLKGSIVCFQWALSDDVEGSDPGTQSPQGKRSE